MSRLYAVDANVLVRCLARDSEPLWEKADAIIRAMNEGRITTWGQGRPPERIAILQPVYNYQNKSTGSQTEAGGGAVVIGGVVVAGGSASNSPDAGTTPDENARRVVPKLAAEATGKLGWPMCIEDYEKTVAAEDAILGSTGTGSKTLRFRQFKEVAVKLGVRYVAAYVVQELVGYVADRWGFSARTTGRCRIDLLVYDANCNEFAWQANVIDTSTAGGESSRRARIDQSLFNALRKALEPFVVKGERRQVVRQPSSLLATVKQVASEGKVAVHDLASDSGIKIGDEFVSLDGKSRLRLTAVLQNGSTAEVVLGTCAAGDIFKSEE